MSLLKYKLYYSSYANNTVVYLPIILKTGDIIVRLPESKNTNTKEENFRLLVKYVGALKEIYDDTKLHENIAN